jgi:hypothetical protein
VRIAAERSLVADLAQKIAHAGMVPPDPTTRSRALTLLFPSGPPPR